MKASGGQHILQKDINTNTIFSNVIKLLERSYALPTYTSGHTIEDQYMRTNDTIRYVFQHNVFSNSGAIEAYTLETPTKWKNDATWTTLGTVQPFDGKFVTMAYDSATNKTASPLTLDAIKSAFKSNYNINQLKINDVNWLYGSVNMHDDQTFNYRTRTSPIGPILNSTPAFMAKDREYINLNFMSDERRAEFENYIQQKANNLDSELLITGTNDGLIQFIRTERKNQLSNQRAGARKAAYFPGFLAARLLNITQISTPSRLTMDGVTNIFEFKNKQGDFQAVGLTGMGAGGKGLVGYQLFKASKNGSNPNNDIKPLFEIVNEDKFPFNTPDFSNLGYTYSGFEFFNQSLDSNGNTGRGIAVFGNGYSSGKSSIYIIDVEDGSLIKEIELHANGGGASTPALSLKKGNSGLHELDYLVVGDQSGRLYKVSFSGTDIATATSAVDIIYQPEVLFTQPITTKPLLYESSKTKTLPPWVYFGTGRKADTKLDRGPKSKTQQYFIAAPVNNTIDLKNLTEIQYSISNQNIISLTSDTPDAASGWYIPLSSSSNPTGNRIVYSPGATNFGDIVFSTWQLEEGLDNDICVDDIGSGLQFALDADTGKIGKFTSNKTNVAGVRIKDTAPGVPSGSTITYTGHLSGALDHGSASTLSQSIIDTLNKTYDLTSHGKPSDFLKICVATTNGELNNKLIEFCHNLENKVLTPKRLSIQKLY